MASEWPTHPLEEVMSAIIDYRGKSPDKTTSGIPLVTAKIVKDGRISDYDEFIAEEDYDAWMRRGMPEIGDVLITTEAPLGEVAQVKDRRIALAQRIILLRGKNDVLDNTFFKYQCLSSEFQMLLSGRASGTTVTGIRQSELRKVPVKIPPLSIQRQIAAILSAFDDKIALNRRMNRTLEQMARALFKSWFVDFDPVRAKMRGEQPEGMDAETAALFPDELVEVEGREVPKGWEWKTVDELYTLYGGSTPSTANPEFWEGGTLHWTSPKDLSGLDVPFLTRTEKRITQAGAKVISSGILPAGTLLLSSRAPVGYLAISDIPVSINQGYIAIEPKAALGQYFTLNLLQARLEEVKAMASGTTFPELSKKAFRTFEVLTPPEKLGMAFENVVSDLYKGVGNNLYESVHLSQLRAALLPRLLAGEIDIL